VWNLAMGAFHADPLFGYGPTLFTDPSSPVHGAYAHAHSQIYQALSTAGLVGLVGLVLFVAALLITAARTGAVTAGLSWALVAITLVTCLDEAPLRSLEFSPFLLLVVVDLGVLLAADREVAAVGGSVAQLPVAAVGYGRSARSAANS
jgi:O-antigen ligase